MRPAEVGELDHAIADLHRRTVVERLVGRVDDDLANVAGDGGDLRGHLVDRRRTARQQPIDRSGVPPDRRGPEDAVAEGVIEVPVGVDDERHRVTRQLAQVGEDLARLRRRRPGIDHQDVATAEHDADLLVEELEAPREDAIADLLPVHRVGWYRASRA